ncbi:helix-turn-helix domain-containing protein [Allokutzneria oryzae]|uniref:Helix-turn-helix domain-containing protein n=1 Tax=Allokutzneria oryzae TaxID=1378989 RepID=A0ABV5ZU67_9PSEU
MVLLSLVIGLPSPRREGGPVLAWGACDQSPRGPAEPQESLLQWQSGRADDDVVATTAAVGPRPRGPRTHRYITLTDLAAATGISISTLSRLGSGQRRPTMELLLPLARELRVPVDELIGRPRPATRDCASSPSPATA